MQNRIDHFIEDVRAISNEQADMIASIRALFNETDSALSEDIKYGGLVFLNEGTLIGGIFPYQKHLSIEFSDGADFSDPAEVLEGKGKRRRHLKIHSAEDIHLKNVVFYIAQSLKA